MLLKCEKSGQQIDFNIPEHYTKVCVNCSGGADSSIILFMTAKYLQDYLPNATLSVLTCSNDLKGRWNGRKAADAIDYTIRKLEFKNFDMHYTYYRDVQDMKYFKEVETKLYVQRRIDILISGITANPPEGSMSINKNGEPYDLYADRIPLRDGNQKEDFSYSGHQTYYNPFTNVDKRFVAAMYEHYDAMDLFDKTRSCEAIPSGYDPNFEFEPCGDCWWCHERNWAFGRF